MFFNGTFVVISQNFLKHSQKQKAPQDIPSLIVCDPLRGTSAIFCGQDAIQYFSEHVSELGVSPDSSNKYSKIVSKCSGPLRAQFLIISNAYNQKSWKKTFTDDGKRSTGAGYLSFIIFIRDLKITDRIKPSGKYFTMDRVKLFKTDLIKS